MSGAVLAGIVLGLMACSSIAAGVPERPADRGKLGDRALDRTLVAGTLIEATLEDPPGRVLTATVSADVESADRWVVIPAGSLVGVGVARRRAATADAVPLEVLSVTVRGRAYALRETVVFASGTRILFVLSEGFTAALVRAEIP